MLKNLIKNFAKNSINKKASCTAFGWYTPSISEKIKTEIIKDEK